MPLTERQELCYTDIVDIWQPTHPSGTNTDGTSKDVLWTLLASNIYCKYFSRAESSIISPIGRITSRAGRGRDQEAFRFAYDQEILDTYAIVLKTPNHPYYDFCFQAEANSGFRGVYGDRNPSFNEVVVKRTKKPAGVT